MASRRGPASLAVWLIVVSTAQALSAPISRCVLEVDGRTYLDGPCNYHRGQMNGSFELTSMNYYAYVHINAALAPEVKHPAGALGGNGAVDLVGAPPPEFVLGDMNYYADGYWQRGRGEVNNLGKMKRTGACWTNDSSRICAYR